MEERSGRGVARRVARSDGSDGSRVEKTDVQLVPSRKVKNSLVEK